MRHTSNSVRLNPTIKPLVYAKNNVLPCLDKKKQEKDRKSLYKTASAEYALSQADFQKDRQQRQQENIQRLIQESAKEDAYADA